LFHILTNTAPSVTPALESQDFSASTGQAISPRGMATRRLGPYEFRGSGDRRGRSINEQPEGGGCGCG
jgi:hypothetical protein